MKNNNFKIFLKIKNKNFNFTITNMNEDFLFNCTSGQVGFKGSERLTAAAISSIAKKAVNFLKKINAKNIHLIISIKNFLFISIFLRFLSESGFKIKSFLENYSIAHNGVRKKKSRRI